jgi:hypothetical protein
LDNNIGSLPYISFGDFNETFSLLFVHAPDLPSSVEKYPKIKYAISDRPHLAATGHL